MLYAGLMLTADGPKVIEYNVRFGDPECQVVRPAVASDLAGYCRGRGGRRAATPVDVLGDDACVTVVLAARATRRRRGPATSITGLDVARRSNDVVVFHAGHRAPGRRRLVTAGGRVLDVTATGPDVADGADARLRGRRERSAGPGVQYRGDIAAAAAGAPRVSGPGGGSVPRR